MGAGLLAVKSGFILFIKNYQFPLQINTLERERERESALRVPRCGRVPSQFLDEIFSLIQRNSQDEVLGVF